MQGHITLLTVPTTVSLYLIRLQLHSPSTEHLCELTEARVKKDFQHLDLFADSKFSLHRGRESFEIVQTFFILILLLYIKCLFRSHTGFSQSVLRYIKTNIYTDFREAVISITSMVKRVFSAWKTQSFFKI